MGKKSLPSLLVLAVAIAILVPACGGKVETGTLQFYANGEDFVRQGFTSKDGWNISFDHVYIDLQDVTGYQADPPYDAHAGGQIEAKQTVALAGDHVVDLAEGGPDADRILVGEVADAPVGQYNAISWDMKPASEGASQGYTVAMVGTAEKDGQSLNFEIGVENEYPFTCGEYVGDERKGFLSQDGTADLEMTFHFDHIFGDGDLPMDDELNAAAPGFEPFAALAQGDQIRIDMAGMQSAMAADAFQLLTGTLPTLGHVGEGHCHYGE